MSTTAPSSYTTYNHVDGGVFLGPVVQGGHVVVRTPREMLPALGGLPAPRKTFTGRDADLERVVGGFVSGAEPDSARVTVISGLGGVGKTELALQAAHLMTGPEECFSGGALFIDLFGYDRQRAVRPHDALFSLLRRLGVAAEQMPEDTDARAALYRTLLKAYADGGHPLLVVVDNAADPDQAAPLLPADGGGAALVTSRELLDGLDARRVALDVLTPEAGVRLLALALRQSAGGEDPRVAEEPDAASRIVELCGRLPLALQIVAARLADDLELELGEFHGYLVDAGDRLDELERAQRSVRAAFTLSYERLPAERARLFRLLSLVPGPGASEALVGQLLGTDARTARRQLEALRRTHLVESRGKRSERRWRMHDLVRLYAAEVAEREPEPAAVVRLLDHYAEVLGAAAGLLGSVAPDVLERGERVGIADKNAAVRLLDSEFTTLLQVPQLAAEHGHFDRAAEICLSFDGYCVMRGFSGDWLDLIGQALVAAKRLTGPAGRRLRMLGRLQLADYAGMWGRAEYDGLGLALAAVESAAEVGDRWAEGRARSTLGRALRAEGRTHHAEAEEQLRLAASISLAEGDTRNAVWAHQLLGYLLCDDHARVDEGLACLEAAVDVAVAHQHSYEAVSSLVGMSEVLRARSRRTGQDASADLVKVTTRARDLADRFGDRSSEALAVGYLGDALREAGRTDEAAEAYRHSAELADASGDLRGQGIAFSKLGGVQERSGRVEEALASHRAAADLLRDSGYRGNEAITLGYLARALIRAGRTPEAVDVYRRALDAHRVAGMRREVENVERKLAELGYATD
ncbi:MULTISPECIES: tetratricopeptide repeat protein [unclassified Streptomyces]|uniref:ATP-binding protein n=1 Tax=unclassified Streptomyces TaxID=2593676 RepID=UPI00278C53F8|nr:MULTISPECIES: tetratricopeptide repeat protein [unclassified Streptomyces]